MVGCNKLQLSLLFMNQFRLWILKFWSHEVSLKSYLLVIQWSLPAVSVLLETHYKPPPLLRGSRHLEYSTAESLVTFWLVKAQTPQVAFITWMMAAVHLGACSLTDMAFWIINGIEPSLKLLITPVVFRQPNSIIQCN